MKASEIVMVLAGMAISASALPGLYRLSPGYTSHHLAGPYTKANETKAVAARVVVDLPDASLTATADVSAVSAAIVNFAESADAAVAGVNLVQSSEGIIEIVDRAVSVDKAVRSAQGSDGINIDSTQDTIIDILESTQVLDGVLPGSTPSFVNKFPDSTQVPDSNSLPDSTQAVGSNPIPDSSQASGSNPLPDSVKVADSTQIADSTQVADSTEVSGILAIIPTG
jgi:hypothetical protein